MSTFVVTIDGVEELQRVLNGMTKALSPTGLSAFFEKRVDPFLTERAADRFATEGDDATGPWAQLMAATGWYRKAKGYSPLHPINVRSGELKRFVLDSRTITTQAAGASMHKPKQGGTGTAQRKLKAAQKGGPSRGGTSRFPARPVVALNSTDADEIEGLLKLWVETAANSAAGRGVGVVL